jgi:hypothetical protein
MVYGNLINTGQGLTSGWSAITSGHFSLKDFFEGLVLTGQASRESYTAGRNLDEFLGSEASQEMGKQLGTIAWDTAAMFVPAPLRRLFAVGNVIEAGREALNGNWFDAGQNLLTAGFQFAGIKDIKQAGAKIAAKNPNLTNAVKQLAVDVPTNIQLKASLKTAPTLKELQTAKVGTYAPNTLTKGQIARDLRLTKVRVNTNVGIIGQELKQEASNLTAKAAQKAGAGWQHVSSNFSAGRNSVANTPPISKPPASTPAAQTTLANS